MIFLRIKDIAKIANVSPATISLVINNKPGVSEDTRKKILKIVDQYGYKPSIVPKNDEIKGIIRFLKYKRQGYVVEQNGDFITKVIDGANRAAQELGYKIIMTNLTDEDFDKTMELIKNDPTDGIIFLGTEFTKDKNHIFDNISCPIIVVDNYMEFEAVDSVVMNNSDSVFQAIKHLDNLGHKDIGYLHSSFPISNFDQRKEGFKKSLNHLGLKVNKEYFFELTPTFEGSYNDMKELLKSGIELPTAIFSDNDTIAVGAMKALREYGIKIPEQLSIIGFDDISFCLMVDPPLSTIKIFKEKMGSVALERLVQKINNMDHTVQKIQIGADLVVRDSTGPLLNNLRI